MDLRRLHIFCEVSRLRSYSGAAKGVGLTQSAVSQQVRALEAELSVALFDAKDRTVPTAAGDYLFREGERILALVRDVENGVRHAAGLGSGTVSFGMIDVAATQLLPQALAAFTERHAQVTVEALVKTSGELIGMAERFELDFAVVVTNHLPEALEHQDLHNDSIVAVVRKRSPLDRPALSIADLRGEPLIIYPSSAHSRLVIEEAFRKQGIVPTVAMEMHYPSAICSLVRQGMGVGLLSELSTQEVPMRGLSAIPIRELSGVRRIGIAFHRGRRLSPQARALVDVITVNHEKSVICRPRRV